MRCGASAAHTAQQAGLGVRGRLVKGIKKGDSMRQGWSGLLTEGGVWKGWGRRGEAVDVVRCAIGCRCWVGTDSHAAGARCWDGAERRMGRELHEV